MDYIQRTFNKAKMVKMMDENQLKSNSFNEQILDNENKFKMGTFEECRLR